MPKKSSSSVRIISANKKKALGAIIKWAKKIKKAKPEIDKVGIFGSYATDNYGPFSDADLIIVLKKSDKHFLDRIPDYAPENLAIDVDIFPYTRAELENMKKENSLWITHILKECKWLA